MRLKQISLVLLLLDVSVLAQTASSVTGIQAIQHDGQTFITWNDVAPGATGANYRYDLYRCTSGPITNLSSATLVQTGIYNNSGQLAGPKPYNQGTRQNASNPMSKIQSGGAPLPLWSGLAVYTNLATAKAYYAVITRDITGSSANSAIVAGGNATTSAVSESAGNIQPILQVAGTDPSRMDGCSNCNVTSASVGHPLWLKLHASGGRAASWGDYWAYWGDGSMGYQDGTQSMFAVFQDVSGTDFNSGFGNQLVLTPQDAVWSVTAGGNEPGADAQSETYWYGYNAASSVPGPNGPASDTGAYVVPSTKNKLGLILPWVIAHYRVDPNRVFSQGVSMGGYGNAVWSLRQANTFAGVFMTVPIIGPWQKIPQLDFGAAIGTASVANGSPTVTWASGRNFGKYLAGPNIAFNLTIGGTTKTVSTVNSSTQLTLTTPWTGASGTYSFVTGYGTGCDGTPACGAGLGTILTSSANLLPDGVTKYNDDTNTPAWVSQNCGLPIPYVSWAAGRTDTTTAGMWNMSVLLANALHTCHLGFSFGWSNGNHSTGAGGLLRPLEDNYVPQFRLNVSFPAFTSFSLDSNYGSGSTTDGDCTTGDATVGPLCYVNYGWTWATPVDTASSWSATITNSQLTSGACPTAKCATTATVAITPRNAQLFKPAAGSVVHWTTSGGQGGSVVADTYGLATVSGISLTANPLTVTLSTH